MRRAPLLIIFAWLCVGISTSRADDTIQSVQQALKDQGFYYGAVTGSKTTDTSDAIRRYQIRNGLQITGDINSETLQSLHKGSRSASATASSAVAAEPQSKVRADGLRSTNVNGPTSSLSPVLNTPVKDDRAKVKIEKHDREKFDEENGDEGERDHQSERGKGHGRKHHRHGHQEHREHHDEHDD
jgi:peptidoglycan hydrolase-like protein with peptidoglycan-binding domain